MTRFPKLDTERSGNQSRGTVRRIVKLIVCVLLLMGWLGKISKWEPP
jgi:hypothetical protein